MVGGRQNPAGLTSSRAGAVTAQGAATATPEKRQNDRISPIWDRLAYAAGGHNPAWLCAIRRFPSSRVLGRIRPPAALQAGGRRFDPGTLHGLVKPFSSV